jgi:hypothetical protein
MWTWPINAMARSNDHIFGDKRDSVTLGSAGPAVRV